MTGIELAADPRPEPPAPGGPARPAARRVRLPTSRGGVAWLIVLLVVGGLLAVQFGRQVYANWEIGQRADAIRAQIAEVEARNAELEQELAYTQGDAWVGAEARRLANLGAVGEEVLIIPPGAEEPLPDELAAQPASTEPLLEQWLNLFFGSR